MKPTRLPMIQMMPKYWRESIRRRFGIIEPTIGIDLKSDLRPRRKYIIDGRRKAKIEVMMDPIKEAQMIHDWMRVVAVKTIENMRKTITPWFRYSGTDRRVSCICPIELRRALQA
jgi:hypothetical protein